ncbi:hypothetical protein NDU88_006522 [Pleurodeles waltl]|uniref:Uncharacterized protein n=1 Tax=Pleurodeles waltl TaxID=8319 RepID=A0AAV7QLC8_PLEWA|nr:hypothetical protein NDU88_006522 [Pleurodeles waltl]
MHAQRLARSRCLVFGYSAYVNAFILRRPNFHIPRTDYIDALAKRALETMTEANLTKRWNYGRHIVPDAIPYLQTERYRIQKIMYTF